VRTKLLLALLISCNAWAATYYMAVGGAGSKTGANCANAYDTSHAIAGSDVIHWCGTAASALNATNITLTSTQSGSAGNPTTIVFESGAIMQSPAFNANGAIYLNEVNYVLIDGGTAVSGVCGTQAGGMNAGTCNGLIQNTDNGTNLTNHQKSAAIKVYGSQHVEIRNLKAQHIYQATDGDTLGASTAVIDISSPSTGPAYSTSYLSIHNNDLGGGKTVISDFWGYGGVVTNHDISFNRIQDAVWGISNIGNWPSDTASAMYMHDNEITHIMDGWTGNSGYHHDGLIIYTCDGCNDYYPEVYNNYIHDTTGTATAAIFCTRGSAHTPPADSGTHCRVYNNLVVTGSVVSENAIYIGGQPEMTNNWVFNNTLVSNYYGTAGIFINSCVTSPCGNVVKNNLITGWDTGINSAVALTTVFSNTADINRNLYWDLRFQGNVCNGSAGNTFYLHALSTYYKLSSAGWQGAGYDTNSVCANPLLDGSYKIPNTSPAYQLGENLTALGITGLNSDALGVGRPSVGAWDVGAYQYVGADPQLVTVSGLGNGSGTICTDGTTCADGLINCTWNGTTTSGACTHSFPSPSNITLTAHATAGNFTTFAGGGCTTSPCNLTVSGSPVTVSATFQVTPTCGLTCVSNNLNLPQTVSCTTSLTSVSGENSSWFILDPLNVAIGVCNYPFSNCTASGQTGNLPYTVSGIYTLGAIANGVSCTPSTQPLNINTPAAGAVGH